MSEHWPWLALAGLGVFHGINPAMGWLFAVALGMHRASRRVVLLALVPIALGHALAIGVVVALVVALGVVFEHGSVRLLGGLTLLVWGVYHHVYGRRRHRLRVGMRTGLAGLAVWSFLMASGHGAGLMLVPVLLPMKLTATHAHGAAFGTFAAAVAAVGVHTLAMLGTTAAVAVLVYEWVGVGFLRRGWINLDLVWTLALIVSGFLLLSSGLAAGAAASSAAPLGLGVEPLRS